MYLPKEMKVDCTLRTGETAGAVRASDCYRPQLERLSVASLPDVEGLCCSFTCSLIPASVCGFIKTAAAVYITSHAYCRSSPSMFITCFRDLILIKTSICVMCLIKLNGADIIYICFI